jgi:hypothetical protein
MKSLIKKLLKENLLTEKLTNVDEDVNLLYLKYFQFDINNLERTGIITKDMFLPNETNTIILKSPDSVKANETNYCIIEINNGSNFYRPSDRTINISVSKNAINFVKSEGNGNLKLAANFLNKQQGQSLLNEFTEEKIKGSIHHELAHWIDDTLNNKHITKRLKKTTELGNVNLNGIPVNTTKMEIQGQIHNIKQLYNKYKNIWDELSFDDMIGLSPPLFFIMNSLNGNDKNQWFRNLKTRMYREGLLGKNMYNS